MAGQSRLTFGPGGDLFVTNSNCGGLGSVLEDNGTTSVFVETFVANGGLLSQTDNGPSVSP
jgi:hypothetical protein